MAAFTDLTPQQVAQLQAFDDQYRPLMGQIAQLLGKLQTLDDAWTGGVSATHASLDAGTVLGLNINYPGAQPLTSDSVIANMTAFEGALASFYALSNRQAYILAAGLAAAL